MIGLDTNILIRYIVQDDAAQASAATRLIENRCTQQTTGFVSIVVLVQLVWVLAAAYEYEKSVIASVIGQILRTTDPSPFVNACSSAPATVFRAAVAHHPLLNSQSSARHPAFDPSFIHR